MSKTARFQSAVACAGPAGSRIIRVYSLKLGRRLLCFGEAVFEQGIQLRKTSPHWMRHTFAKGILLQGYDLRQVTTALGHTSLTTTMIYTEQDALDQIRAWEQNRPGTLAEGR